MSVPLLRAKLREEEAEVGLEATKKGYAPLAKVVVLPLPPDEAFVVDVTGGLNGSDMIKQADGILVKTSSRVGDHGEEGDVKTLVWFCVLHTLGISTWLQVCRGPTGIAYGTLPGAGRPSFTCCKNVDGGRIPCLVQLTKDEYKAPTRRFWPRRLTLRLLGLCGATRLGRAPGVIRLLDNVSPA